MAARLGESRKSIKRRKHKSILLIFENLYLNIKKIKFWEEDFGI